MEASKEIRISLPLDSVGLRIGPELRFLSLGVAELDMDWIHPWIGLDWIR